MVFVRGTVRAVVSWPVAPLTPSRSLALTPSLFLSYTILPISIAAVVLLVGQFVIEKAWNWNWNDDGLDALVKGGEWARLGNYWDTSRIQYLVTPKLGRCDPSLPALVNALRHTSAHTHTLTHTAREEKQAGPQGLALPEKFCDQGQLLLRDLIRYLTLMCTKREELSFFHFSRVERWRFTYFTTPHANQQRSSVEDGVDDDGLSGYCVFDGDLLFSSLYQQPAISLAPVAANVYLSQVLHNVFRSSIQVALVLFAMKTAKHCTRHAHIHTQCSCEEIVRTGNTVLAMVVVHNSIRWVLFTVPGAEFVWCVVRRMKTNTRTNFKHTKFSSISFNSCKVIHTQYFVFLHMQKARWIVECCCRICCFR